MGKRKEQKETRAAYVLCTDIVGFTKLKPQKQPEVKEKFKKLILSCAEVNKRARDENYRALDTGDGFAIAFFNHAPAALLTAIEFSQKVKKAKISCRMGLHGGPVYPVKDINERDNVIGNAMNYAQRVMDLGDDWHILASKDFRDWISKITDEYNELFHFLGHCRVKHGEVIEVYNVYDDKSGNPKESAKGKISLSNRPLSGPDDPLLSSPRQVRGRNEKIAEVLEFFESDESLGVVTAAHDIIKVTGSPGIGKTELCKAALSKWLSQAPGRKVYYVGLAGANGVAEFASRLIEAYSLPETLDIDLLPDALSAYPGLLYLDNLEDLINDNKAIELLDKLSKVPGLRILASSREILSGLGREIGLRELDLEPAISLFVEEWRKNGGKIDDSPELREFLEKDLGCHPLTIVLVAAQARYYPALQKIRAAWQEQGTKLAKWPKGKESPLTSLDISISLSLSSIKREPESEKAILLWGLLIFFPEGMTENAWEFYKENSGLTLESLNLLVRLNLAYHGSIKMLPPVRKFAETKAKEGADGFTLDTLIKTAFPYFMKIAKDAAEHSFDEQHQETLDTVLAEFPNIQNLVSLAAEKSQEYVADLSNLNFCLQNFYQFRSFLGLEIISRILPLQINKDLNKEKALSLEYLGDLESNLDRITEAEGHYQEAMGLYRSARDNLGLANVLRSLGNLESNLGRLSEAEGHYQEAQDLYRSERSNLGLANVLTSLGDLESRLGRLSEAEGNYQEAQGLYRSERANLGLANVLWGLGDLERRLGRLSEAEGYYQEAQGFFRSERSNLGLANVLKSLGHLYYLKVDYSKAVTFYEQALALYSSEKDIMDLAYTCAGLARALNALGETSRQDEYLKKGLEYAKKNNIPSVLEYHYCPNVYF